MHKRSLCDDGRVEYGFPDEAVARKFADRFGGEYVGTFPAEGSVAQD